MAIRVKKHYFDNENNYEAIFDRFSRRYKIHAGRLVSWRPYEKYNGLEIEVVIDDGRAWIYNDSNGQMSEVIKIDNVLILTEEEWRRGFSYELSRQIKKYGVQKQDLAQRVGVSQTMMSRYIQGQATPSGYVFDKIAYELGCGSDDLQPYDYTPIGKFKWS